MSNTCPLCGATSRSDGSVDSRTFCGPCTHLASTFSRFLEAVESPAALIARNHTIVLSNAPLRRMLEGADRGSAHVRIGDAVGCAHALTRGPCGETCACPHCGLKRIMELSRITGETLAGIELTFRQISGADCSFTLSAEKAGEAVLLRVDRTKLDGRGLSRSNIEVNLGGRENGQQRP